MEERISLVSLLSNWYSGATLFSILLNNHSQLVTNGEAFPTNGMDNRSYICSCGKPLLECEFYQQAAFHMISENATEWQKELFVQLPCYSNLKLVNSWLTSVRYLYKLRDITISTIPRFQIINTDFITAQLRFFLNSMEIERASYYVDGTKSVRRAELFADNKNCDQKIIHLVRDGRGFFASYKHHKHWSKKNIGYVARAWLRYINLVDIFSRRHPEIPLLVVRYEDLCHDPEKTMMNVCNFLEIPYQDRLLGKTIVRHHVLGNRMRNTFNGKIIEDMSWKAILSKEEIDTVTYIMINDLRRFSYI